MNADEKKRVSRAIIDLLDILEAVHVPDELMQVWEARNVELIAEVTGQPTTQQTPRAIGFVNTRTSEVN